MNNLKLSTGEPVQLDILYPTYLHHVDLQLTDEECLSIFDAIDQNMQIPDQPKRKSTTDMVASYGNLIGMNNPVINKVKNAFLEITNKAMEQKFGEQQFKEYFRIHDILIYGTVMASGTHDSPVRHNYPWDYSSVLFVKSPREIEHGQGALMFVNKEVNTDNSESQGVLPVAKHMLVFPSHLMVKDKSFRSKVGDIRVTLNCNVKYVIKSYEEAQGKNYATIVGEGISDEEYQKLKSTTTDLDNEW